MFAQEYNVFYFFNVNFDLDSFVFYVQVVI